MMRLIFSALCLILGATAALADSPKPSVVTMLWGGNSAGQDAARATGPCSGITGCFDVRVDQPVGNAMNSAGDQASSTADARFTVDLVGKADKTADGYQLSLIVSNQKVSFSPNIPADKKSAINAEAIAVNRALKAWKQTATADEIKQLNAGSLSLKLAEPFDQLKLLSKPDVSVTFEGTALPTPLQLVFKSTKSNPLGIEETLSAIPYFTPFWVEATYADDQSASTETITLSWPGGSMDLTANRASSRVYKSALLVATPASGSKNAPAADGGAPK